MIHAGINKIGRYARTVSTVIEFNAKTVNNVPKKELAQWLSVRMESLGPTYIKIGQFMSSRKDIFGDEYVEAFASLRDRVRPMDPSEVSYVFKNSLDMKEFKHVDPTPIASASIGQVHRGQLKNGKEVIIKIRRPNVGTMIKEDTQFLLYILSLLKYLNLENIEDSIELINDFERNIIKEVDFRNELENLKKFRAMYKGNTTFVIPRVYSRLSSEDAIVMEYVESKDVQTYTGDKKVLANKLMDFFINQLITHGYIHGDPHPGNMGVTSSGAIVLYDFGNIITVSDGERQRLKELIYFLLLRNKDGVINSLQKLGIKVLDVQEMYNYIDLYIEYLQTIDISKLSKTHGPTVKLPLKFTDKVFRLVRVYGALEGACKELDKNFNYFDLLSNYIGDIFMDEEFIRFKVVADTSSLLNSWLEPLDAKVDSKPAQTRVQKKPTSGDIVDKKHTPVMLDSTHITTVLVTTNLLLLLGNMLEIFYK